LQIQNNILWSNTTVFLFKSYMFRSGHQLSSSYKTHNHVKAGKTINKTLRFLWDPRVVRYFCFTIQL